MNFVGILTTADLCSVKQSYINSFNSIMVIIIINAIGLVK